MKHSVCISLIATFVSILFTQDNCLAQRKKTERYSLAVLNLAAESEFLNYSDTRLISGELTKQIVNAGLFFTMSQNNMEKGLLAEDIDPVVGCSTIDCAVQAGHALGVQLVVMGKISKTGSNYTLETKMIHVSGREVVRSLKENIEGDFGNLYDNIGIFSRKLLGLSVSATQTKRSDSERDSEEPYSQPSSQEYDKDGSGGFKWAYVGIGLLVTGGVGAGIILAQSGSNGDGDSAGSSILPGPPTFP